MTTYKEEENYTDADLARLEKKALKNAAAERAIKILVFLLWLYIFMILKIPGLNFNFTGWGVIAILTFVVFGVNYSNMKKKMIFK